MTNELSGMGDTGKARKLYTAEVQARTTSNTSCAFCWFVLQINPTLKNLSPRDTTTFAAHLKKSHGLQEEIQR